MSNAIPADLAAARIIEMLKPEHAMLEGAISGRALYDGRIDPAAALAKIRAARSR